MNKMEKHLLQLPLGIAAGASIGLGGFLFGLLSYALPNIYGKILGSIAFAVGLFLVCTFYFSLYTGKVGLAIEKRGGWESVLDLFIMFLGNLGGAVGFGYIVYLIFSNTGLNARFVELAASRAKDFIGEPSFEKYISTFLAAFLCGLCVYLSVKCFAADRLRPLGTFGLVFFVFVFVYCGFEHCIANMFYFSAASKWSLNAVIDIVLAIIGNSLGTIPGIVLVKLLNKNADRDTSK